MYWSFTFNIMSFQGLISFRMDWLDILAVQGTLKSFLQYQSSKASIFGAQLSLETNSQSILKLMSIESVMPSNHLILSHSLLLLPSIFLPSIRVFSNESALGIRGRSIGASALATVLPMNTQGWFLLGLIGLISMQSKGLSRVFSNTTVQNISSLVFSFLYSPTLSSIHDYWKNHSFD